MQLQIHPQAVAQSVTIKKDGTSSCAMDEFSGTVNGTQTVLGFTARTDDSCYSSPTSVNYSVFAGGKIGFMSVSQVPFVPKTYMVSCKGAVDCSSTIHGASSPIPIYFRPA